MTTIYLINNSLTMNNISFPDSENLKIKREKRILSIEGEEASKELALDSELQNINVIYSSHYVMSLSTAKYLATKLELDIKVKPELGERILGAIGDKKISMIQEMQEADFNYRLTGGESLNDVITRMTKFINKILKINENQNVALFTHNVAITSLLINWCEKGYNLDNRLILNYQGQSIVDGSWMGISIIKLEFDGNKLVNITRKK